MAQGRKTVLTEEQLRWLDENFPTRTNKECCEHLVISLRTVIRIARERGLYKNEDFWTVFFSKRKGSQRAWVRKFRENDPKGYEEWVRKCTTKLKEAGKPYQMKKSGDSWWTTASEEKKASAKAKAKASRESAIARDRVRVVLGKEPIPKLPLYKMSKDAVRRYRTKWYLCEKYGYVMGDGATLYYIEGRRRSRNEAKLTQRWGIKFSPYADGGSTAEVKPVPDWTDAQGGFSTIL